jgi:O-6-methylguanine DNA methyltransferase
MKNIDFNSFYYYKCLDNLGFLEIILDDKEKVLSSIFVEGGKNKNILPLEISKALDDYFYSKKDLPNSLISENIKGTDFQKSIWGVICDTRFGENITYTDMAERVDRPRATRAAGTACGKNPLALFIPCHRVVRKQKEDYGYSWGSERKKKLLRFENKI